MSEARKSKGDLQWFDGHLDLACLALEGRDLTVELNLAQGQPQPATITFPSLMQGQVTHCWGTIFTAPGIDGPCGYSSSDDRGQAHETGLAQLEVYRNWAKTGQITLLTNSGALADFNPEQPLTVALLMEGADPIRNPDDMLWWFQRGLRAVGLAWSRGTRYAGGNGTTNPLTDEGLQLVHAIDDLGIVHDLSHLSDTASRQLLDAATGPVMASHSNCRALVDGKTQRHLTDDLIKEIAQRDGIIGLNLFSQFLIPDGQDRRATIDETIAHVEYIVNLVGHTRCIALGSDLDGGFGSDRIPVGIESPADLSRLTEALSAHGWNPQQCADFATDNWLRFLQRVLPDYSTVVAG